MKAVIAALTLLVWVFNAKAEGFGFSVGDEVLYFQTQEQVLRGEFTYSADDIQKRICPASLGCATHFDIIFQALDALIYEGEKEAVADALEKISTQELSLADKLRVHILNKEVGRKDFLFKRKLHLEYFFSALFGRLDKKSALILLSNPKSFSSRTWRRFAAVTKKFYPEWASLVDQPPRLFTQSPSLIRDIFEYDPKTDQYASGAYHEKPRLYMFCRTRREYPCLMLLKDGHGNIWRDDQGDIWHQPALAYSRHKKEYNQVNGNTPAGIHRIDGVMPKADQQRVFGKFRRLILNFIGPGENESYTKLLLPESSHNESWWLQASVARDIGRSALRIHGTGLRSKKRKTYYPLVPTSGCVAQRENTYDRITYFDQRLLLDEFMKASGLEPIFENEPHIRGLFYIIEIDDQKKAVTLRDLESLGLFQE